MARAPVFRGNSLERQESKKQARPAPSTEKPPVRHRPASEAYLERAALHYLSRFASSTENFKAVLWRKVQRRGLPDGTGEDAARAWIDRLAEKFTGLGLLDDETFARGRAGSLLRRGKPRRVIRQALVARGVTPDMAEQVVAGLAEDHDDPDFEAALAFARRKRLGGQGRGAADPERRRKDLAAFARAGFSYQMARRVLDLCGDDAA